MEVDKYAWCTRISMLTSSKIKKAKKCEGVIVYLDALGIKGVSSRDNPINVATDLQDCINQFLDIGKLGVKLSKIFQKLEVRAFSDTVIFSMEKPPKVKFEELPIYIALLIIEPFCFALKQRIYFRGTISIGQFYKTKDSIIGPAVDEASEWYQYPEWIGVSTAPSAFYALERLNEIKITPKRFFKYNVPIKEEKTVKGWALSWPYSKELGEVFNGMGMKQIRETILNNFSTRPIDYRNLAKYSNTIEFFDYVCSRRGVSP